MKTKEVIVLGCGSAFKEISDFIDSLKDTKVKIVGVCDPKLKDFHSWNGLNVIEEADILNKKSFSENLILALGSPKIRKNLYDKLSSVGYIFPNIIHKSSYISLNCEIEKDSGVVIGPLCYVGPEAKLGSAIYMTFKVGIAHECIIGDFVQFGAGVNIAGNCSIGNSCFIGIGSTIIQNVKISENITVGAGSTVFSSLRKEGTYLGVPAKLLKF